MDELAFTDFLRASIEICGEGAPNDMLPVLIKSTAPSQHDERNTIVTLEDGTVFVISVVRA